MPVHRGNISQVILSAWKEAHQTVVEESEWGKTNILRSQKWIDSLAQRFKEHYAGEHCCVFWRDNDENRNQFGLNELLFDIAVCRISATKSLQAKAQDLSFVAQCHWQIESEFSKANTRDIVVDMSKLVMGSAENKLIVAARRGDGEAAILEQCSEIAACCSGRVYFCFVSHPENWGDDPESPTLHEWIAGGWAAVAPPAGA